MAQKSRRQRGLSAERLDFSKIILDYGMSNGLAVVAHREGFLSAGHKGAESLRSHKWFPSQVLPLLVLFDRVLLMNEVDGFGYRSLEDQGVIQVLDAPPREPPEYRPQTPLTDDLGVRVLASIAKQALEGPPLFIDSVKEMVRNDRALSFIRTKIGVPYHRMTRDLLRYILWRYDGDDGHLEDNSVYLGVSDTALSLLDKSIDTFSENSAAGGYDPLQRTVFALSMLIDELVWLTELSQQHRCAVASRVVQRHETGLNLERASMERVDVLRGFALLRCAVKEEGGYLPPITSIRDALRLRRDPNVGAFRQQLRLFQEHLAVGDAEAVRRLRQEVRAAYRALARVGTLQRALNWITYLSVPIGVLESLVVGAPPVGLTLGVLSAAGTHTGESLKRRHSWALLGR